MGETRDSMGEEKTSTEPAVSVNNLQPDTTYYFKVSCITAFDEESDFSNTVSATTKKEKEEEKEEPPPKKIFTQNYSMHQNPEPGPVPKESPSPVPKNRIPIIIVIIALILLLFSLLRQCTPSKPGDEPPTPLVVAGPPKSVDLPELAYIPSLTYNDIHFVMDTRFFLSEGNFYTNTPPDFSEGRYEDRLNTIAGDMKNILAKNNKQIFLIRGYAADIPGYEWGEFELSEQRVEKVKSKLIELGVPSENLESKPIGGTFDWGDNLTEETKRPNRVVTIEIKE